MFRFIIKALWFLQWEAKHNAMQFNDDWEMYK